MIYGGFSSFGAERAVVVREVTGSIPVTHPRTWGASPRSAIRPGWLDWKAAASKPVIWGFDSLTRCVPIAQWIELWPPEP